MRGFSVAAHATKQRAAYASRAYLRGDVILAEEPLRAASNRQLASMLPDHPRYFDLAPAYGVTSPTVAAQIVAMNSWTDSASEKSSVLFWALSFFNHSCDPNSTVMLFTHPPQLVALGAIAPGAHLFLFSS